MTRITTPGHPHRALLGEAARFVVPKALAPLPVFAIAIPVNFVLVRLAFKGRRKRRH